VKRQRDDDDEEDSQPTYLSPAWHRARRLAQEAAKASSSTTTQSPPPEDPRIAQARAFYEAEEQKKARRARKIGASPFARRRLELRFHYRRCDVKGCGYLTDGMSSLCKRHKNNRAAYGHPKVNRRLQQRDYLHLIEATLKYWKKVPPPQSILESTASFLTPPGRLTGSREPGKKARLMLIAEMVRWQDPRYRKKYSHRPGYDSRKAGYAPRDYLAVMVAVEAYMAERDGQGFPGDVEFIEKAFAIARLHRRPGSRSRVRPGRKLVHMVNGTVLRAIAARLRQFNSLGVYIHQTAREVLKEPRKKPKPPRKRYAPKPVAPAPAPAPLPRPEGSGRGRPPSASRPTVRVRHDLPPQYPKPTTRPGCTIMELRAWEENRRLWRNHPQGFYFEDRES
jgi:hypothetical protein